MAESEEELKSLLMKMKEESEKAGLKCNIQNTKIMASCLITSWQRDVEKVEIVTFYFGGRLQNHCGQCLKARNQRHFLFDRKAMRNQDSILKNKDITLTTMVHLVKAMVFPSSHIPM